VPAGARYVSPSGSDSAGGTVGAPFKTLAHALPLLRAGDTLVVRGGTYTENVKPSLAVGTASSRITVIAYPGERPIIKGLLWLSGASYWTLDGINVTWNPSNGPSDHMVKMTSGTGWRLTDAEIWGAHSFAGILVAGTPKSWTLDHLYVHDTYKSNAVNQDHLVYVNGGDSGGLIEHNIFARSLNGRGVKVGPPSGGTAPIGNVVIRYNTFMDNGGPSNVQLSYGASGNQIYRNIFVKPGSGQSNVTAYNLNGTGNVAYDNIGWQSGAILDKSAGLTDGGGNIMKDPRFVDPLNDFHPQEASVQAYGRYAS
jgi:Protein of unknown function (DUF1565)